MHPRAVRREDRAVALGDVEPRRRSRVGSEPADVLLAEAPLALVLDPRLQPGDVDRRRRELERPALDEVRVDAFGRGDRTDLVDGREQRPLQRDRGVAAVRLRGRLAAAGEQRRAPAAVATRRAEARRSRLRAPRCAASDPGGSARTRSRARCSPAPTIATSTSMSAVERGARRERVRAACRARSSGSGTAPRVASRHRADRCRGDAQLNITPKLFTHPQTRTATTAHSTMNDADATNDAAAHRAPRDDRHRADREHRADRQGEVDADRVHQRAHRRPPLGHPVAAQQHARHHRVDQGQQRAEREEHRSRASGARRQRRGAADGVREATGGGGDDDRVYLRRPRTAMTRGEQSDLCSRAATQRVGRTVQRPRIPTNVHGLCPTEQP